MKHEYFQPIFPQNSLKDIKWEMSHSKSIEMMQVTAVFRILRMQQITERILTKFVNDLVCRHSPVLVLQKT